MLRRGSAIVGMETTIPPRTIGVPSDGSRPRKMRKGTHSCFECKRRKVRCYFPSSNASSCVECELRGSACVSQDYARPQEQLHSGKGNVRDRIGRLEALVESLMHNVEQPGQYPDDRRTSAADSADSMTMDSLTPSSESSLDTPGQLDNATLFSLFDNAVISRTRDGTATVEKAADSNVLEPPQTQPQPLNSPPVAEQNKYPKIRQALLATLPTRDKMDAIFGATAIVWEFWHKLFPFDIGDEECESFPHFVDAALRNGHPTLLARLVICVAISVQQMPASHRDRLGLPTPVDVAIERDISTVRRLVASHDELVSSVDGLNFLMLLAKYHVNMGQPRKAWLLTNRGVALAQLLGIHRDSHRADTVAARRRKRLWWDLYQWDRFSSLLLGLPYSARDRYIESSLEVRPNVAEGFEQRYRVKVAAICGRLVDVQQSHSDPPDEAVAELDEQLDSLALSTPEGWWSLENWQATDPATFIERKIIQFWHHHVRIMLHVPWMLRASVEPHVERSRAVCLNSAREMIKRYRLIRYHNSTLSYSCKVIDFEAFTAAVVLVLDLLGSPTSASRKRPEEESDWSLVNEMVDLLRESTTQVGSVASVQALKVLETLRAGRDRDSEICRGKGVTLVIPFFGTVNIAPGTQLRAVAEGGSANGAVKAALPTPDLSPDEDILRHKTPAGASAPLETPAIDPLVSFNSLLSQAPHSDYWLGTGPGTDGQLLGRALSFDLDQDWNWLLDDPNVPSS